MNNRSLRRNERRVFDNSPPQAAQQRHPPYPGTVLPIAAYAGPCCRAQGGAA